MVVAAAGTYRPREWSPLADRDPVPGDPAAIREEIASMRRLAQGLRDQAGDLKAIAAGEGLKGKYATALRDNASELELRLRQTAERYEHVHGHLSAWVGELEDFQATSVTLLRRAQDVEHDQRRTAYHQPDRPDHDDPMQPLRQALTRLTEERDDRASYFAGRINRSCNDVIKDSTWESIEDEADSILDDDWASVFFEAASWVTTAVGLAALFLTPAGWVVDLALAFTLALAAKDVLAFAVGDGSWFDLSMDAVGLLTIRTGTLAFKSLTGIRAATKLAAEAAVEERAVAEVLHKSRAVLDRTYRITNSRRSSDAAKAAARQLRASIFAASERAGRAARIAESTRAASEATQGEALAFGGDKEAVTTCKEIGLLRREHAQNEAVLRASEHAEAWEDAYKAGYWIGAGFDLTDKSLGSSSLFKSKWSLPAYDNFKDRFAVTSGSEW